MHIEINSLDMAVKRTIKVSTPKSVELTRTTASIHRRLNLLRQATGALEPQLAPRLVPLNFCSMIRTFTSTWHAYREGVVPLRPRIRIHFALDMTVE